MGQTGRMSDFICSSWLLWFGQDKLKIMGKNFDCYGFLLNQKLLAFLWQRQTRQVRNSMLIKMLSLAARGQSKFIN